jgi:hypothetical protein
VKAQAGKSLDSSICQVACELLEQDELKKIMASS